MVAILYAGVPNERSESMIAEGSKVVCGKRSLLGLEFLQTNDVSLSFGEPSYEVFQALIDIIDVEGDDLQRSVLNPIPIVA